MSSHLQIKYSIINTNKYSLLTSKYKNMCNTIIKVKKQHILQMFDCNNYILPPECLSCKSILIYRNLLPSKDNSYIFKQCTLFIYPLSFIFNQPFRLQQWCIVYTWLIFLNYWLMLPNVCWILFFNIIIKIFFLFFLHSLMLFIMFMWIH